MSTAFVKGLEWSDKIIGKSIRFVIFLITIMASCTMLLQVVARYVFEIAISGLDELTGHTAVWLYLMGAAYGSFKRSQIKAEMIHLFIKNERALLVIRAFASIVSAIVAGYMVAWSWEYANWSLRKHEVTPALQLPTVIFQVSIFVGAVIMFYYFVRDAIELFIQAFRSDKSSHKDTPWQHC